MEGSMVSETTRGQKCPQVLSDISSNDYENTRSEAEDKSKKVLIPSAITTTLPSHTTGRTDYHKPPFDERLK